MRIAREGKIAGNGAAARAQQAAMPVVGFLDSASLEAFADGVTGVFHHRRKSRCRSIKRQEWRKGSNPRQAAPCSVNYNLSVCKDGIHPRTASTKDGIHKDEIQSTASNLSVCKDGMWRMSV
jgi:hypothetical protein